MSKKTFIRRDTKSRTFFHCLLNAQFRSSAHELDKVMDDNYRPAVKEQIRKIRKIPKTLTDPNFRFKLAVSTRSLKSFNQELMSSLTTYNFRLSQLLKLFRGNIAQP